MGDSRIDLDDYEIPFKGIVEQSLAGIYIIQDEKYYYVNETFAAICGLTPLEMIGTHFIKYAVSEEAESLQALYERRIRGELPEAHFTLTVQKPDSKLGSIEIHGKTILLHGRPAIVGVGVDVTERQRKFEELEESRARLRELMSALNTAREKERTWVAQELHDGIGGMLSALKFDITRLSWKFAELENDLADGKKIELGQQEIIPLVEAADQLLTLTQEAIHGIRKISEGLRPMALDHFGLLEAISLDLQRFQKRYGIQCYFRTRAKDLSINSHQEVGIYRIFQEAMTNIARHSRATEVRVHLIVDKKNVILDILDNGVGLSAPSNQTKSMGLLGMQERAQDLSGALEIRKSMSQGGTRILLRVPYLSKPSVQGP